MIGMPNKTFVFVLTALALLATLSVLSWLLAGDASGSMNPNNLEFGAPASRNSALQQPFPTFQPVRLLLGCGGVLEPNQEVQGTIATSGQECVYTFEGTSGDFVVLTMERLDGDLDPFVELYGPDGSWLASNDDVVSGNLNSQLVYALEQSGTYQVVAKSFGSQVGSFTVKMEQGQSPWALSIVPWCSGNISDGETIDGNMESTTSDCGYTFAGHAGDIVTVRMERTSGDLDPVVRLMSPSDSTQPEIEGDDAYGRNSLILHHRLRSNGEYKIVAAAYNDQPSGEFKLELTVGPFSSGDQVEMVFSDLANLRRTPGYLKKPNNDVVTTVRPRSILTIDGGPTMKDGLTWWHVRYGSFVGWIAETRANGEPFLAPPF